MKKILLLFLVFMVSSSAFANETKLITEQNIQKQINNCGMRILNANKVSKRVVFVYSSSDKKSLLKSNSELTDRQVILYDDTYKFIENNDELAAFLSRGISLSIRSFDGIGNGFLRSLQIKAAPKKFEIVADKRAVDYMVNAGYNPVGLITFIQKTSPQKRQDTISSHNLTSKRLAIIYEYIYTKYPYYLKNNPYIDSDSYQNFLLTSQNNRRLLEEKIKSNSKEKLNYE